MAIEPARFPVDSSVTWRDLIEAIRKAAYLVPVAEVSDWDCELLEAAASLARERFTAQVNRPGPVKSVLDCTVNEIILQTMSNEKKKRLNLHG